MTVPPPGALAAFSLAALVVFMFVVVAAGMFPADHRTLDLTGPVGGALFWGSIAVVAAVAVHAVVFAADTLPWYAAVIAGGAMMLAAPFVLRFFPVHVADNRIGVVGLAVAALLVDGALWAL